ncbi:creatininase family protein [Microbacterium sediminicola]|uniref:Creatininase family protein n=1 Tax=Microbacterium sediminicola TaxID=415210 RepID=A0ABP4UH23_9MICO
MSGPSVTFLAELSTNDAAALSPETVIVQPIGAIEQHGAHLPLVTDALVAEALSRRAAARSAVDVSILPTLSYGRSIEHRGWAGTISMSSETLLAVCRDVGRSVAASGFTKLVFVNGHGGQPSLLDVVARDIRAETGLQVFSIMPARLGMPEDLVVPDDEYGYHGGHVETSIMLALAPELVRMECAEAGGIGVAREFGRFQHLTLEGVVPSAWLTDDVTHNGILGDPTTASREVGDVLVDVWSTRLAEAFGEIAGFRYPLY